MDDVVEFWMPPFGPKRSTDQLVPVGRPVSTNETVWVPGVGDPPFDAFRETPGIPPNKRTSTRTTTTTSVPTTTLAALVRGQRILPAGGDSSGAVGETGMLASGGFDRSGMRPGPFSVSVRRPLRNARASGSASAVRPEELGGLDRLRPRGGLDFLRREPGPEAERLP